jgi:hypothetical protein
MPRVAQAWLRPLLLCVSFAALIGLFSREISDPDFWWHLRSGQYLWETRSLADPDPFAYTTAGAAEAYPGEQITRRFNLTHEWLAELALYAVWRAAGWPGVVLGRAALLAAFCAVAGFVAWRRTRGFYRALAVVLAAASVAHSFVADRPYLVTFVFTALVIAILDSGKPDLLWLLPPILLVWANCHGGFLLGWFVMAAFSADALLRRKPAWRLWTFSLAAIVMSGLNPNGFQAAQVLLKYRESFLTSTLAEWRPLPMWPPTPYNVLLALAAVVLLRARRRVRLVDGLLFAAFAAAALAAGRNTFLIGLLAPILIATYLPKGRPLAAWTEFAAAVLVAAGAAVIVTGGNAFQWRAAEWAFPAGAAEFLRTRHITGRLFNTYEHGGYLIWKLWPLERVFIDGRALSESVFRDYGRILHYAGSRELLDRYGVEVILMNTFEYSSGVGYALAPAVAEFENETWKLVYSDAQAVIFMRHPPAGVPILGPSAVEQHMEAECETHIEHEPDLPGCARALGLMFTASNDPAKAVRWLGTYLRYAHGSDPEAENALRNVSGSPSPLPSR